MSELSPQKDEVEPPEGAQNPGPSSNGGLPPISPDWVEQEAGEKIDNVIPTHGYHTLPMVGLGGSAGSIPALQQFFEAMPAESGMAFVVILHLAPENTSVMDEIIGRSTSMRVVQAEHGQKVEANTVYVIPPGKFLSATDGHLRLTPLEPDRGKRVAVDLFFRTLADTHGPNAAAIILSGADGDGALGIKRIKERGGLTVAQDPEEAQHPSMPRTAIDTGMVDWVLPVAEIPARLLQYRENGHRVRLPSEDGPQPAQASPPATPDEDEAALREVLVHLRSCTGRDFSYYKRATIVRRVARRMQVNGLETVPDYLGFLRTHAGEAGALLQDLLISVTNFFRDRDAFAAFKAEIPALFRGKTSADAVRVWCAGCATGEEAYSVAMLLLEHAGELDTPPAIQVFATDLSEDVITDARDGLFPFTIAADVSEERLRRFFVKEYRGYRARSELRECLLFAVHDLLKDAPFSRLDVFSCRNLLIYLTNEAQARVFGTAHFALRPEGILFLGPSETADDESGQWTPLDKMYRLYRQRPTPSRAGGMLVPVGPLTIGRAVAVQGRDKVGTYLHGPAFATTAAAALRRDADAHTRPPVSWEALHFKLIERFAPPSLIVTRDYDIVHMSENAGRFLHFTGGEPSVNLLRVVHPVLRVELRAALFRAGQTNAPVEVFRVPLELDGATLAVDIRVSPAQEIASDFLLVVFAVRGAAESAAVQGQQEAEPAIRHLEREMEHLKSRLRDTIEQYEGSCEELKAGNEELQAMNEELRSSAEELETSREELQSVNEELFTVNEELKSKLEDLGHANADLANLMSATGVVTIFLDRQLHIMRYTPGAVALFRLIPSDVSRPLTDLNHRLNYPELTADAKRVLETLIPVKREVTNGEQWFHAQLLPYRTTDDHIAGVVLTFIEITEARQADQALRASEERFRQFAENSADVLWIADATGGRLEYVSPAFERIWGESREAVLSDRGRWAALLHPEDRERVLDAVPRLLAGSAHVEDYRIIRPDGAVRWIRDTGFVIRDEAGTVRRIAGIAQDVTEMKEASRALDESRERLRLIVESAGEHAIITDDLERRVTSWNPGAERIIGYRAEEMLGQPCDLIFTPEDRAADVPAREAATARAEGRAAPERRHKRQAGTRFWASGVMLPIRDRVDGEVIGFLKIFRDETERVYAREALESSRAALLSALAENERARADAEAAGRSKDHFLAVLSHELRTPLTPVLMAVHTLARRRDLPAPVLEALDMIRRNVQLEAHFVDDLLDVTRIARGKMEIVRAPLDLHEAIAHAVEISRSDFEPKKQRLTVALDATEHRLDGDAPRLQQVVWNLLKNASKFTPESGEITLRTRNEEAPGGRRLLLEVTDTGIGIEAETLPLIFDPFAQANAAITREFGGLGLGLAISKATVEAHGGEIRAESAGLGRGATVCVSLPLFLAVEGGAAFSGIT